MYTKEEASNMWCPMERTAETFGSNGQHQTIPTNNYAVCISEGCMMWRWEAGATGYCGLAGKP